jgi:hypothetical protein
VELEPGFERGKGISVFCYLKARQDSISQLGELRPSKVKEPAHGRTETAFLLLWGHSQLSVLDSPFLFLM